MIENVTGTAFVVAEFRAEENNEAAPLYRDSIVGLFLDEDTKKAAERIAGGFAPVKDMVKIRTKYFDDVLEAQIVSRVRQVVILGAGLDTRAARKPAPGVTYFEIDDAATLEVKRARYRERGLDDVVTFIPGNYVTDGVIHLLDRPDFDFELPTYFIWEGNTMYLPLDSTRHVLAQLKKYLARFQVSFDYLTEAVISRTTGDAGMTRLVESFAAMGAPWLSGIGDIHSLAYELGLTLIDNFKTAELHQKYWAGRSMRSPIFSFYSVCTMGADRVATQPVR
jgi:methyltransferase (TIGR00027 family)